jgi:GPH family glycoside/pentoside/hexuronide:cation symporter
MNNPAHSDSSPPVPSEKLNFATKLAYGAGDLGTAITANLLIFYLAPFLTDVAGLSPGLAARSQLVGKVWDAVNDPMVGVLSDRTSSRWGRRYPWMVLGAVPFGIVFFLQWIVPKFSGSPDANQMGLFWYYTIISILFNAFYTVVNLPYVALTPELTQDYNERTNLNSFRFGFSIGGSILSVLVVAVVAMLIPNDRAQQYLLIGAVCAVFSVLPVYWCVLGTRKRIATVATAHPEAEVAVSLPLLQQLRIIARNRAFLCVIGIYLCSWLSLQLTATIIPYFVSSWMRFGNPLVTVIVILAVQGTAMVMLFVWSAVSRRVGKRGTYFLGMGTWIIAQFGLFFLQPGQTGFMYFLAFVAGFGVSVAYLVPWSMLPDVIELDELQTGQRREGIFYSLMVFLQKICIGLAVALVLELLGLTGYIKPTPADPLPVQPDAVLWVIRLAIGPFPTVFLIAGMVLTYLYPITREAHTEILLKLQERKRTNSSNN